MKAILMRTMVRFCYRMIKMGLRFSSSFLHMKDGFFARIFLRDLMKQLDINCVIDVGAHEGSFANNLRSIGYNLNILSFEPNPGAFRLLFEKFSGDPLWQGFNFALGSEQTNKPFHIDKMSSLSSMLEAKNKEEIDSVVEVEVRRLDSIFDDIIQLVPNPRIFLKVDTQGYDVEVIKGAGRCLEKVVLMQSEISVQPIYDHAPHYLEALSYYETLGFQLLNLFPALYHEKNGSIIEYDCLMVKE